MEKLEEAIVYVETVAKANESLVSNYECDRKRAETHRQLAAYLRELQERRKSDSCEGCVYEEGSFLRCVKCKRNKKYYDRYEPGRRTDEIRTP